MRLLDLFCGAGGAGMGYHRAGFEVVGVDLHHQPHYPFEFHQADALEFPLEGFDAIHASPPCQAYTAMQMIHKNGGSHPDLLEPTRSRLIASGRPFVIENVVGAPMGVDLMLCGTMFGLPVALHRWFETNIEMPLLLPPCDHTSIYDPFHGGEMARGERVKFAAAKGIDWEMTRPEVRNAIPPAYTEFIGRQLLAYLGGEALGASGVKDG